MCGRLSSMFEVLPSSSSFFLCLQPFPTKLSCWTRSLQLVYMKRVTCIEIE